MNIRPCPPLVRRRPRGFTLIEILVVVAIIGVLAAILLPAMNRALSSSHVTRTVSDLKQLKGFVVDGASQLGGTLPLTKGIASLASVVSLGTSPNLSTSAPADFSNGLRLEDVLLSVPSPKLDRYFAPACGSQVFLPTGGTSVVDPRYSSATGYYYNQPDIKIPSGYSYNAVSRLDCIATSAALPSVAAGANFYLDGINSLPTGRVAFAIIKAVPAAEAYQIALALDTAAFMDDTTGSAGVAQNRGQVAYAAAANGVTDVYVYLSNF